MAERKSGAFRQKKNYFTQVSNNALRDIKLSLKAKGLYALIQSYITQEDFILYKDYLKNQCAEGDKAFESTWKELKEKGYLIQYRFQDLNTKYFYYEYDLLNESDIELANDVHNSQNRKKYNEKTHNSKKGDMDNKNNEKAITTKKEDMDNRYSGKVGVYTNTNINNINTSSSSNNSNNLLKIFKDNICELKKTTLIKFNKIVGLYSKDFINAVIEECANTNVKSYKGFEVALQSYVDRDCKTSEDVINAAMEFRVNRKKEIDAKRKYNKKQNNIQKGNFNNYEQRKYDFDKLEDKLRGLDKTGDLSDCMISK